MNVFELSTDVSLDQVTVRHVAKLDAKIREGVGTSKIRTSKGQNIESFFRMIRTSKVKKIRTSKLFSERRK